MEVCMEGLAVYGERVRSKIRSSLRWFDDLPVISGIMMQGRCCRYENDSLIWKDRLFEGEIGWADKRSSVCKDEVCVSWQPP